MLVLWISQYAQSTWDGGPGVCGVVTSFGSQFCSQDSVSYMMPGQINPIATSYNWGNWILDTVEITTPGNYGNVFPADMDLDGDYDLVGYRLSTVLAVYLNDGFGNFTPINIENVSTFYGNRAWPVWVKDVDLNGLPDILAPMGSGLYVYYQVSPLTFNRQAIVLDGPYWCGTYISFADAGDIDNDGDIDIVATNGCGPGSGGGGGDVILLRNDGATWTPIMIYNSTDDNHKAMRIYLVDFDNDGYLDILTSYWPVMVFRNLGGTFTLSNYFGGVTHNSDGAWPVDVDNDGDIDIAYAPYQSTPKYAAYLRNDGGFTFTRVNISTTSLMYDGVNAGDFNVDGFGDFLGAWRDIDIYVGPTFTRFNLSTGWNIHNLYFANLETYGCFDIQQDIVFTNLSGSPSWGTGHYFYRNRTATRYASFATLTSSILMADSGSCAFDTLFYMGCSPLNWQINVYVRWSFDSTVILTKPWVGPLPSGTSLQSLGLIPWSDNFIQYKVEFVRTGPPDDNAPRLDSIWIKPDCSVLIGEDELSAKEDKMKGGERVITIYTVDGRKVKSIKGRGIYFIYDGKNVRKVISF